jgi:hypothetical protein
MSLWLITKHLSILCPPPRPIIIQDLPQGREHPFVVLLVECDLLMPFLMLVCQGDGVLIEWLKFPMPVKVNPFEYPLVLT